MPPQGRALSLSLNLKVSRRVVGCRKIRIKGTVSSEFSGKKTCLILGDHPSPFTHPGAALPTQPPPRRLLPASLGEKGTPEVCWVDDAALGSRGGERRLRLVHDEFSA
jgi:hypothetical protein